jgi:cell division inhibitor SulA
MLFSHMGKPIKKERELKIQGKGDKWIGYTPILKLSGNWLTEAGFSPDKIAKLTVAKGKITITVD